MTLPPIRIVVADDHPIVRQGLRLLLSVEREFELVGEAKNGAEAVEVVGGAHPDVVILDLMMPGTDGQAAIPKIRQVCPETRILILTSFTDDELVVEALRAGAAGCMIKDSSPEELLEAVRAVARGESALHPLVAQRLVQSIRRPPPRRDTLGDLTARELEVLRCVGHGLANQQIADELQVSIRTVHSHIRNLLDKLDLENRIQLALYVRDSGLL
ncbi:MAG: response regulator transcription factor [Chloroflexales bacterium]|nr:response regulator transcription factor [Chloroflexales bacterium]